MDEKRKILFITPDFMDYTDIIYDGIEKYLDAEVHLLPTTGPDLKFKYRNSFHRFQNFLSKILLGKNQKKEFYKKEIEQKLDNAFSEHSLFDDIFILRPDLIQEHLPEIKIHGKRMIAYFWDSFGRMPAGRSTIRYFDKFFSFEPKDVKEHGLYFLSNFYAPDLGIEKNKNPQFDLSYTASFDDRITIMEEILSSLKTLDLKTNINILSSKTPNAQEEKNINWLNDTLSRKENIRIMNDSIALLDIAQSKQEGLSFRFFEAMALEKKLITTNASVSSYDFYNPENIFIRTEKSPSLSKEFFTKPYTPISSEITNKYSLENWIKKIFE